MFDRPFKSQAAAGAAAVIQHEDQKALLRRYWARMAAVMRQPLTTIWACGPPYTLTRVGYGPGPKARRGRYNRPVQRHPSRFCSVTISGGCRPQALQARIGLVVDRAQQAAIRQRAQADDRRLLQAVIHIHKAVAAVIQDRSHASPGWRVMRRGSPPANGTAYRWHSSGLSSVAVK